MAEFPTEDMELTRLLVVSDISRSMVPDPAGHLFEISEASA